MTRVYLSLLILLTATAAQAQARFALVVGQNSGGEERATLRFAEDDARHFAEVLERLGGAKGTVELSLGSSADTIWAELAALRARAKSAQAAGQKVEVVFYYSGHADEEGLLIDSSRIGFKELRDNLTSLPADVRVAIIDACASGAFTAAKGGKHVTPFLVDEANAMRGHAFLTSASADESAQESARLAGSFFTHALVTGLRGAADVSGDKRVTLDEAYRYAFDETLARTERTRIGPQHPGFDIQLTGRGELVLTDLRKASATLSFPEGQGGRIFVRDASGKLAAELTKASDREVNLGLEPGDYALTLEEGDVRLGANLSLSEGAVVVVDDDLLGSVEVDNTVVARGDTKAPEVKTSRDTPWAGGSRSDNTLAFNMSLIPFLSLNDVTGGPKVNTFTIDWLLGHSQAIHGLGIGLGATFVYNDVLGGTASILGNVVLDDVRGFQLAVGPNIVMGDVVGLQASVLGNLAGESSIGLQSAVGLNLTLGDRVVGQMGVGPNIVTGQLSGAQVGTAFNYAGRVRGAQIALINFAPEVSGTQVGLINLAGVVKGAQVGLVNLALDVDGASIGLLSGVLNGYNHIGFYASDLAPTNLSLTFGSKYVYTVINAGISPFDKSENDLDEYAILTLGLGGHVPVAEQLYVDFDVSGGSLYDFSGGFSNDQSIMAIGRAMVGWQPAPLFAVFGGLSLNSRIAVGKPVESVGLFGGAVEGNNGAFVMWPGAFVGVRL